MDWARGGHGGRGGRGESRGHLPSNINYPPLYYSRTSIGSPSPTQPKFTKPLTPLTQQKSSSSSSSSIQGSHAPYKRILLFEQTPEPFVASDRKIHAIFISSEDLKLDPYLVAEKYFHHPSQSQFFLSGPSPIKVRHTYANYIYESQIGYVKDCPRNASQKEWIPTVEDHEISMSQLYIYQIPDLRQWGDPWQTVNFKSRYNSFHYDFTYNDMVNSFWNVLWYQNREYRHTWLIRLNSTILKSEYQIPAWFLNWYSYVSIPTNLIPQEILDFFALFKQIQFPTPKDQNPDFNHVLAHLHFFAHFQIPWLFSWSYETGVTSYGLPQLRRVMWHKWWPKVNLDLNHISSTIQEMKKAKQASTPTTTKIPEVKLTDTILEVPSSKEDREQLKASILKELEQKIDAAMEEATSSDSKSHRKGDKRTTKSPETTIHFTPMDDPLYDNEDMDKHLGIHEMIEQMTPADKQKLFRSFIESCQKDTETSKGKAKLFSSEEISSDSCDSDPDFEAASKASRTKPKKKERVNSSKDSSKGSKGKGEKRKGISIRLAKK